MQSNSESWPLKGESVTSTELSEKESAYLALLESSMKDMDELTGGLQALIYGDSGVGKTVAVMYLAAELTPADKSILYVDSAQGYKVRANHSRLLQRKFHRVQFSSLNDTMKLGELLARKAGFLKDVGAVIFDESTSMSAEDLQVVVGARAKFKEPGADPNATSFPDRDQAKTRFLKFANSFAKLDGIHCFHVGHVRSDNMPNGLPQFSPSFGPALGAQLRQPMDLVSYMTVNEEGERVFRNHPMKGIVAKSRVKDLSPTSDFGELLAKTKAWLASDKAEADVQETIDPMDTNDAMEI